MTCMVILYKKDPKRFGFENKGHKFRQFQQMGLKPSNAVNNWNNIRLKIEQEKLNGFSSNKLKTQKQKKKKKAQIKAIPKHGQWEIVQLFGV